MLFKLLVTLSFLAVTNGKTDEEIKSWFINHTMECSKEHPVSSEEIQMMQQNNLPDTANTRCLMACVFKKTAWLDDKGMFDVEQAYALVEKEHTDPTKTENAKKLFDFCKKVNEEPVTDVEKGCDRSFFLAKCLTENAPKYGFPI